ncbi:MAG: hypothetical protein JW757_09185 [Anaerolineales bacterium]|nr:hypothetical protein [Anaerolineales bacterium]
MQLNPRLFRARWWLLAVIVFLQLIVLVFSPSEKTLGTGIKPVYLHVSFTWTGMLLLTGTALLGLVVLFSGNLMVSDRQRLLYQSALVFYLVGFLVSMYASWLNWGGIPWQEPKIQSAINVIVAASGAWYLREFIKPVRLKGLAGMIPFMFISMSRSSPRMVLHPDNPVNSSPLGIRTTFLVMFVLAISLAVWFLWVRLGKELEK